MRLLIRTDARNPNAYRYAGMTAGLIGVLAGYATSPKSEVRPLKFGEVGVVIVEAN